MRKHLLRSRNRNNRNCQKTGKKSFWILNVYVILVSCGILCYCLRIRFLSLYKLQQLFINISIYLYIYELYITI